MTNFIEKNIAELKENKNNVRKHSKKQIEQLKKSIEEFGFTVPLVVNSENIILAGHGRFIAAKSLNLKNLPCVVVDYLSEKQQRAYALVDNRIGQNSEWDRDLLLKELELLGNSFDFLDFGFSDFELPNLIDNGPKLTDFISPTTRKELNNERDTEADRRDSGTYKATIKVVVAKEIESRVIGLIQDALNSVEYQIK